MNKAIAITQQGNNTLFLIGDYQATLFTPSGRRGWRAEYFKKGREVLNSNSESHPVMPDTLGDKARAQLIVEKVIGCLHSDLPIPRMTVPNPRPKKINKRPSKRRTPKMVTPEEVLEDLLGVVEDSWTIRIPSGKPAALRISKVQICNQNNEVVCEIPYPVYRNVCCVH